MQTAAWWQSKMNTQLASWAELRHDNLLYAKQSYTGGITCEYPDGYVEPVPAFYQAVVELSDKGVAFCKEFKTELEKIYGVEYYFSNLKEIAGKLKVIAEKELSNEKLTDSENQFLKETLYLGQMCGPEITGWYSRLFIYEVDIKQDSDQLIADVHTVPTDEMGNDLGLVMHVGTGLPNLMVVAVENCDGDYTAYCGPVYNYLEHNSLNYKRLTDSEWKTMWDTDKALKPEFTDLYMADKNGRYLAENPVMLPVGLIYSTLEDHKPEIYVKVVPNPASESALLILRVPSELEGGNAAIEIYDLEGNTVKTLYSGIMTGGNYSVKWDLTNHKGKRALSGTYLYVINIDNLRFTGKFIIE